MTPSLAGWTRRVVDGGVLMLASDPRLGVVRIRAGLPLRPARQVVEDLVRRGMSGAAFEQRSPPRAMATAEGEHAAIFELVARPPDLEIRRTIAVLIGDHQLVTIDGRAVRPEAHDITDKVVALASAFTLGLGTDRWRRFFYLPPPGWHRLGRFHAEAWLAPDYPRNPGTITVFHARPLAARASAAQHGRIFEDLTAEFGQGEPAAQPLRVASGLTGEAVTFRATADGRTRLATNVALSDSRTVHLLRLETDPEHAAANQDIFSRVVLSVEPIPTPRPDAEAFLQWSE